MLKKKEEESLKKPAKKPMSEKKKAQVEKFIEAGKNTRFTSSASAQQGNEIQRKGGKARAKKAAERKSLKEVLEIISTIPMHDGETTDLDKVNNVDDLLKANKTLGDQIAIRLAVMASNGNLKAMELYRDQIGEKPVQTVDVRMDAKVDLDRADIDELLSKL